MAGTQPKILIVEDDRRIRMELMDGLEAAQFQVEVAHSLQAALRALQRDFDLLILDLGLPDGDGLDLCRDLRRSGRSLPIIILTARDSLEERVRGLDLGADDYVVKPFFVPELVSRVRSVLRRMRGPTQVGRLEVGELWLDPGARQAGKGSNELELKPREFELLMFLLANPDRAWTRDQLLDRVWGMGFDGDVRTVDIHVRRLRQKIEDDPESPTYLKTVWGVGYKFRGME